MKKNLSKYLKKHNLMVFACPHCSKNITMNKYDAMRYGYTVKCNHCNELVTFTNNNINVKINKYSDYCA